MSVPPGLEDRIRTFLASTRVGVDFGEHRGGIAVVRSNGILHSETFLNFTKPRWSSAAACDAAAAAQFIMMAGRTGVMTARRNCILLVLIAAAGLARGFALAMTFGGALGLAMRKGSNGIFWPYGSSVT